MNYFTLVVNNKELNHLKKIYHDYLKPNQSEHVFFAAKHNNIEIIGYNSGKLVLSGSDLSHEILLIKKSLNRKDYEAIGSDEVGTGDVFGPIVVCATYVSVSDVHLLETLNVRDSKSVSDDYIIKIAPTLAKKLTHSLIILNPSKYNKLVSEGYNLNKIKALLHNQAIVSLRNKINNREVPVIVDQFCQPNLYFSYLKDEILVYKNIDFFTKAENVHLSVAASAIIARYGFLYAMQNLSKKLGISLLKGASKKVDDQISLLKEKHGLAIFDKIAKANFKNITKLVP